MDKKEDKSVFAWGGWNRNNWFYTKKETFWYVLLFVIPFLTYKLSIGAMTTYRAFNKTGIIEYPEGFVFIAFINFVFCALVLFLLKDSESGFRMGAIILTSILPAFITGYMWYRRKRSSNPTYSPSPNLVKLFPIDIKRQQLLYL